MSLVPRDTKRASYAVFVVLLTVVVALTAVLAYGWLSRGQQSAQVAFMAGFSVLLGLLSYLSHVIFGKEPNS